MPTISSRASSYQEVWAELEERIHAHEASIQSSQPINLLNDLNPQVRMLDDSTDHDFIHMQNVRQYINQRKLGSKMTEETLASHLAAVHTRLLGTIQASKALCTLRDKNNYPLGILSTRYRPSHSKRPHSIDKLITDLKGCTVRDKDHLSALAYLEELQPDIQDTLCDHKRKVISQMNDKTHTLEGIEAIRDIVQAYEAVTGMFSDYYPLFDDSNNLESRIEKLISSVGEDERHASEVWDQLETVHKPSEAQTAGIEAYISSISERELTNSQRLDCLQKQKELKSIIQEYKQTHLDDSSRRFDASLKPIDRLTALLRSEDNDSGHLLLLLTEGREVSRQTEMDGQTDELEDHIENVKKHKEQSQQLYDELPFKRDRSAGIPKADSS